MYMYKYFLCFLKLYILINSIFSLTDKQRSTQTDKHTLKQVTDFLFYQKGNKLVFIDWTRIHLSVFHLPSSWQDFPAVRGDFMDSPYNGNASLQTSTSNLNASYSRPSDAEDDGKVSSDTIWLWIAVLATIGNIVVVAVVCACAFWHSWNLKRQTWNNIVHYPTAKGLFLSENRIIRF